MHIERLLSIEGVDVNARESDGSTSVLIAAEHGHARVISFLKANGADARRGVSWLWVLTFKSEQLQSSEVTRRWSDVGSTGRRL